MIDEEVSYQYYHFKHKVSPMLPDGWKVKDIEPLRCSIVAPDGGEYEYDQSDTGLFRLDFWVKGILRSF